MDKPAFYSALRKTLYKGGLPQSAVNALEDMLRVGASLPNADLAYCMATAYHEVGRNLVPIRESLNYSASSLIKNFSRARISTADANRLGRKAGEKSLSLERQQQIANLIYGGEWGRKNLGNTIHGDGWRFRGGGYPQTTGRANYRKIGQVVGVDLEADPIRITDRDIAVQALIGAMRDGLYTGRKLSDYSLPAQFAAARAIINADGDKNGEKIAGHARSFLAALEAARRVPGRVEAYTPVPTPKPAPAPAPVPPVVDDLPPRETMTGRGTIAAIVGAILLAAGAFWTWLAALPCTYLNLFCGG